MSHHLVKQEAKKEEPIGIVTYRTFGKIFISLGVILILLLIGIGILPQNYEKYNIPLMFGIMCSIALLMILAGAVLVLLCRKSTRFQNWAEKDVTQFTEGLIRKEMEKENKAGGRKK
jgi:hypothetical protein